ncbi:hypothetical protein B0T16DRAFT_488138 [Cercophora newfieldiana]|uniref:Uncharacterized protein n=1 Tax=Cercophora newfieldiana TaxID=92897 RepID=A0AA39YS18_9PEZI|nr:hypothetical protein B0T16DRAFT_488138 [Cercophora newfieldiana]
MVKAATKSRRAVAPSLKPRGFYGWAFVAARVINFLILVTLVALIGRFLALPDGDRQNQDTSLIATLVLTNLALFWSVVSWSGYSKRHIRFAVTWTVDLAFVIAFTGQIALIGVFLQTSQVCSATSEKILAICPTLNLVWYLSIGVCALFAASGFSVGWVHLTARRPRSPLLGGVVVDRSISRDGGQSQSKMRVSPSWGDARSYKDPTATILRNADRAAAQSREARVGDIEPVATTPFRTTLGPIDERVSRSMRSPHYETSHRTAATTSARTPRRRRADSALVSFASEPHMRDRTRTSDRQPKSHANLRDRASVPSRTEHLRQGTRIRGQQAAADILRGTGRASAISNERRAHSYFESLAAPVPMRPATRTFSPLSWTGNTEYSSDHDEGDSPRSSSDIGEIPLRLSLSPVTTPTNSLFPHASLLYDDQTRIADSAPYFLPRTTYKAPKPPQKRDSSSVYETEYASSSSDESSILGGRARADVPIQRPMPAARPSRSIRMTDEAPSPPMLAPAPWSREVLEGPHSRPENDSLAQSRPFDEITDVGGQTVQVISKPRKNWWMLGFGGDKPSTGADETQTELDKNKG